MGCLWGNAKRPASAGLAVRGQLSEIERVRETGRDGTDRLQDGINARDAKLLGNVKGRGRPGGHLAPYGLAATSAGQGVLLFLSEGWFDTFWF